MFCSVEELNNALNATGYIADSVTVTTVYLAAAPYMSARILIARKQIRATR